MTMYVFEADRNLTGSPGVVFAADVNPGGTQYTKTLTVNQDPTVSLVAAPVPGKTITAVQDTQVVLTKQLQRAYPVTQTATLVVTTDTTLAGALTTVNQDPVPAVVRSGRRNCVANQSSVAIPLAYSVSSGSSHSTYFITLSTIEIGVAMIGKGIQQIPKAVLQDTVPTIAPLVPPRTAVIDGQVPAPIVLMTAFGQVSWPYADINGQVAAPIAAMTGTIDVAYTIDGEVPAPSVTMTAKATHLQTADMDGTVPAPFVRIRGVIGAVSVFEDAPKGTFIVKPGRRLPPVITPPDPPLQ